MGGKSGNGSAGPLPYAHGEEGDAVSPKDSRWNLDVGQRSVDIVVVHLQIRQASLENSSRKPQSGCRKVIPKHFPWNGFLVGDGLEVQRPDTRPVSGHNPEKQRTDYRESGEP